MSSITWQFLLLTSLLLTVGYHYQNHVTLCVSCHQCSRASNGRHTKSGIGWWRNRHPTFKRLRRSCRGDQPETPARHHRRRRRRAPPRVFVCPSVCGGSRTVSAARAREREKLKAAPVCIEKASLNSSIFEEPLIQR